MTDPMKIVRGIRYARAKGATLAEMQRNVSPDMWKAGDAVLCWVNEGDLCHAGLAAEEAVRMEREATLSAILDAWRERGLVDELSARRVWEHVLRARSKEG